MVKLLCAPDSPTDFKSVYVETSLRHEGSAITEKSLLQRIRNKGKVVIKSHGGSGKTFLTRNIWLSMFSKPNGMFPILIELRGVNFTTKLDLETYIRASAFKAGGITPEAFRFFCSEGNFAFILDGFDEVEREHRELLEAQILELSHNFPKCSIVVTGRPDDRFSAWTTFSVYSCLPLEYERFRELIGKAPFDDGAKKRFLKVTTEQFFIGHEEFLSNPLLALMMLITYRDNAEIPRKLNVFYENCFMALYTRHDALKEQYRRPKHLDQEDFRRVFSYFSLFSYLKQKPQMSESEIRQFAVKAIEFSHANISVDALLDDLLEAVSLIQKDGVNYTFIHRSFQEYFAAYCATKVLTDKATDAIDAFASRPMDKTLALSYEMHPDLVANGYFVPRISDLNERGIIPTPTKKQQRYSALHSSEFAIDHYFEKGSIDGFTTSWGPNSDLAQVQRAFDSVFLTGEDEGKVADLTYELHQIASKLSEDIHKSTIKSDLKFNISINFSESEVRVQMVEPSHYKRTPPLISKFLLDLKQSTEEFASELEQLLRKKNETLLLKADALRKTAETKSVRLADEFGL